MPHSSPCKTNPQYLKQVLKWVKMILAWGFLCCKYLFCQLGKTFSNIKHWLQHLPRNIQLLTFLVLIGWIFIITAMVLPGQYPFEGNLRAASLSFTYTGQEPHLFLTALENLRKIDLQGSQPQPLTLVGQFSSTDPTINSKLKKLNKIAIQLPHADSRIILTSNRPKNQQSELAIPELRINSNTQIDSLSYQPQPPQISFCSRSIDTPQSCHTPESIKPSTQSIGSLVLRTGEAKIHIILGNFKSPQIGTLDELAFDFIPANDELQLELLSPTQLFLELPNTPQPNLGKTLPQLDPIWGDIDVKNVQFLEHKSNPTNVLDEQHISTILEGKVRMERQIIDLQADQFLIIPSSEPGISKIRYIRHNLKAPFGLSVSFTGNSKGIATGLYPEFPVQEVKPNLLSRVPQEVVNAILSFLAALFAVLLPQLLPKQNDN
jgi:hypothetical protein